MNKLLRKALFGKKIIEDDVEEALEQICEDEHSSCSDRCPVYEANNHSVVKDDRPLGQNKGCLCFRDGRAMRNFLLNKKLEEEETRVSWRVSERKHNKGTNEFTKTHLVSKADIFKTVCGLDIPTMKLANYNQRYRGDVVINPINRCNCKRCGK